MNALKRRNPNNVVILLFLIFVPGCYSFAQSGSMEFSILFYNTENLFDSFDNPETSDEEFTPMGARHWTSKRLNLKLQNLSKVILASAKWQPPAIVGLCEIENNYVFEKLLYETSLKSYLYKIIHKESPDPRGIEVAMLYDQDKFLPLTYRYIPLKLKNDSILKTREILYVKGKLGETDTFHIFINHWPSRFSEMLETKSYRNNAGALLKSLTDKILQSNPSSKIVIMGDFNDQPTDQSLSIDLKALNVSQQIDEESLYNLSGLWQKPGIGTLKFQSQWSVFDQIIVSGNLLKNESGLYSKPENAIIVSLPFLFERDEQYGGQKLKRTYVGFSYNGGFSDHLPVLLKLSKRN